jgi:hypothetical protein
MEHFILRFLNKYFKEVEPLEFYRNIFPPDELGKYKEKVKGKYNAIAVELLPKEENNTSIKRYIVNDDLRVLEELLQSDNFIIISPISYCGKSRESKNARFIYALAFDIDGITEEQHIIDLFYQMENKILPLPTYTVFSGSGLHLYYQFETPIPCFKNIVVQLAELKKDLTKSLWNKFTTELYKSPQIESLFQGFRLVGGVTKNGERTKAFKTGNVISINYLNDFVDEKNKVVRYTYKSDLTLSVAAEKFPDWYEKRIIQQQPKGTWICKRDLFEWWKRRMFEGVQEGHRYYCVMCLAIYAKKCGVSKEELESYAFSLVNEFDKLTTRKDNKFTRADILAALEMYNDNYIRFPIKSISSLTNIPIEKNKRNGRKQKEHIKYMNTIRKFKIDMGEIVLSGGSGAPTKEHIVREWQKENPNGTQYRCVKDTGLSVNTVKKWWFKT